MKDIKAIEKAINEAVDAKIRMESERDLLKEITSTTSEKHEVDKKVFNKMVALAYKRRYQLDKYQEEKTIIEEAYDFLEGVSE